MNTHSPKTGQGGRFLGMALDDGGAWVPNWLAAEGDNERPNTLDLIRALNWVVRQGQHDHRR